MFSCGGSTSHLKRHIKLCHKIPNSDDEELMLDDEETLLKKWQFDDKAYRDSLARSIIRHDLPFSYAEYDAVLATNKILNPDFVPICRNTAKTDCMLVFSSEKERLKSVLASIPGRVCLTSDVWTAVTTQGYMTVTAHYVDQDWKLNSKLLSFCHLDNAHTGVELSGKLFGALKDWGIDRKIFSLTLDNASSNDNMIKKLKQRLNLQDALLCKGKYFHVRCCAHILNLIVQDGLKAAGDALHKIRESVKYVKASEGRLREFRKCIQEVHLDNVEGGFLRLDVCTRWNATYMMLESAIRYRPAFISLSDNDKNYTICPSTEEWERAQTICNILAPFYNITCLISGSSYTTSNLYFMQVAFIEMALNKNLNSEDEVIKDMTKRMKDKFDKYWSEYSVTLSLGNVLDPTSKLEFLKFCFKKLYPNNYEDKIKKVKDGLHDLFDEYKKDMVPTSSSLDSSSRNTQSHSVGQSLKNTSFFKEYRQEMIQKMSNDGKSELEIYLDEKCLPNDDVDILQYWKLNSVRFPQLAIMACDILSIPITTVASESSFSIGGRILNKYRNCLLPETVQALICTRNWLHDFKEIGPSDIPEVEEIQLGMFSCGGSTSHLKRHIKLCHKIPNSDDEELMLDDEETLLKKWQFDDKAYRDSLARSIIRHDLPFSYAEYDAVLATNKILNPDFVPICRNTAKTDCMLVFSSEKERLKSVLASIPGRVCLTSDVWTAVTTQGYMTVTAHYVDQDWKLNSKLLSFCHLDNAHTGVELSGKLFGALKDWGIDRKIFSLTLDNASSNDNMIKKLKQRLNLQDALLCKGKYFHVRCCAHILNLIVQDGLKAAGDALHKIRESVKYVKASEGRLREFRKCIQEVHLDNVEGGFLRLDVCTRWNATYMMLESAIRYRPAFISLSDNDKNYTICTSTEEWERAQTICNILAPFYNITCLISGSSYTTSNLYFMQVAFIEMALNKNLNSEDEVIKDMTKRMKDKFDKYWSEYSVTLSLGNVLDPTSKLEFLKFCFKKLYPNNYEDKIKKVKDGLHDLFDEYKKDMVPTSSSLDSSSRNTQSHSVGQSLKNTSFFKEYRQEMIQKMSNDGKSELEIYLDEKCLPNDDVDILQYWKLNSVRFPQLAIMACDILSIPITTVASESSFSIGGRILNKYRNCLLPETVQALICTRNWLHDFKEIGPSGVEDKQQFSMYFFLPNANDGLSTLVEKVASESELLDDKLPLDKVEVGDFRIPRFNISFKLETSDILKELGVVLPFYGGLTKLVNSNVSRDLHVSDIFHKSFIKVNEEGTEAAAATAVTLILLCAEIVPTRLDFVADHPFLFMIREDMSRTILFVGWVLNPLTE
ncbi:zinc finger BED domain-containing protein RICESLEEPER [Trifolium repens]|nr:zinc finger BED domain-containing protein RICESLEEPER [Trifolium repens]